MNNNNNDFFPSVYVCGCVSVCVYVSVCVCVLCVFVFTNMKSPVLFLPVPVWGVFLLCLGRLRGQHRPQPPHLMTGLREEYGVCADRGALRKARPLMG